MNYSFKIQHFFLAFAFLVFVSSCNKKDSDSDKQQKEEQQIADYVKTNNISVQPTSSGLYYISEKEGTGDTPGINDIVVIRYKGWTLDGQLFDSTDSTEVNNGSFSPSFKLCGPFKFNMKVDFPGWTETLMKMKAGGKAIAIMPSILVFNDYVPRKFEFELIEVIHDISAYEKQKISNYVAAKGKSFADSTATGNFYFETITGIGTAPSSDKTVAIQYIGMLLDGRVFGHSDSGTNYSFALGANAVLPGIEEAILKMKVGGMSTIVIPYYRAYDFDVKINSYNQIVIPWYSTLVYYIQLMSVQ